MGRGKMLSKKEIGQIEAFRKANYSIGKISKELNRSYSVVYKYLKAPQVYGTKHTGRPKKLLNGQQRILVKTAPTGTTSLNEQGKTEHEIDQVFQESSRPNQESKSETDSRLLSTTTSTNDSEGHYVSITHISASQFAVLKKLATLKLYGIFDRFELPSDFLSIVERNKEPSCQSLDKLFGVSPMTYLRRTGKCLSPGIASLMEFIEESSKECVGIFRKPGVQSRILSLQKHMDLCADEKFDTSLEVDPYDAADVFKRYLRDLPETLLTEHLCSSFSLIFSSLPSACVTECLQYLIILLPDVNRSVLYEIFHFLNRISQHSTLNQMTPANMAVCILPSLFRMNEAQSTSSTNYLSTTPLCWDHKSALLCLTHIIERPHEVFCVPKSLLKIGDKIHEHLSSFTFVDTNLKIHSFHQTQSPDYVTGFLFSSMKNFNMYRGWAQIKLKSFPEATISISSERNGSFLPSWRCQLEILAPPVEVINKIHKDSQPWVGHLLTQHVVDRKIVEDNRIHHEVISYEFLLPDAVNNSKKDETIIKIIAGRKKRTCELRAWKTDLPKESCFYCCKSIVGDRSYDDAREVQTLESSFFLEPCGEGLTRLTHISTVDLIGHSVDWYEAAFPPIILGYFTGLQLYFKQQIVNTGGPETKV